VTVVGAILESMPPYTKWKERAAEVHLSGHSVSTVDGTTYLISRVLAYDQKRSPVTKTTCGLSAPLPRVEADMTISP
jgi:hypothetical protein